MYTHLFLHFTLRYALLRANLVVLTPFKDLLKFIYLFGCAMSQGHSGYFVVVHVGSSPPNQGWNSDPAPAQGTRSLSHWTMRETPSCFFFSISTSIWSISLFKFYLFF